MQEEDKQAPVLSRPFDIRAGTDTGKTGAMGSEVQSTELGPFDPSIDVSIVIVNWNGREILRDCLNSVHDNVRHIRYEVIVVDNGSRDGSPEMLERDFPNVRLLANASNTGFTIANNQGLSLARGRYLLLLNSDTIVLPEAIEGMVRYMDDHPRVGLVGPRLLNADGSTQLSVYPFPNVFHDVLVTIEVNRWPLVGRLSKWYGQRRDETMSAQTGEVDYVLGACMLFRREPLNRVGVLDDNYFFGGEDMDLSYRLHKDAWLTVHHVDSQIIHLHGGSRKAITASYLMWYYAGKLRFYRLHHPRWQYIAMRAALVATAIGHMLALFLQDRRSTYNRSMISAYAHLLVRAIAPLGWG
jgi:GT2 family glycosyltransferase